jgi:hypothetical protein
MAYGVVGKEGGEEREGGREGKGVWRDKGANSSFHLYLISPI